MSRHQQKIFSPDSEKLGYLLHSIHERALALPDFQRDFVWDPRATEELLESILQRFPAGVLLRIKNGSGFRFSPREFAGAPKLDGHDPNELILDGQQRLTSLYQALYGAGSHRYFIDLQGLLDGKELEDCVYYLRAKDAGKRFGKLEQQAEKLVFPLSNVFGRKQGFDRWLDDVLDFRAKRGDDTKALKQKIRDLEEEWIDAIREYEFPVVTLAAATKPEAVCTIFETLNRTGVKLSVFDLLTARFWSDGLRLRTMWDDAREQSPILGDFDVDPYYVLQAVAIHTAKAAPSCKRSDVLGLEAGQIRAGWEPIVRALAEALHFLRDECGVVSPTWLPYAPMLVTMAALFAKAPSKGPAVAKFREYLRLWYWSAVFNQSYDNPPNSQTVKDYVEFLRWFPSGTTQPESITPFAFDSDWLRGTTHKQRAMYRGVISLQLRNGARDFHQGQIISSKLVRDQDIDDHHIFPDGWFEEHQPNTPRALRDCVLNRTLIDKKTNIRIGKRAPSDYLAEIEREISPSHLASILGSHLLPAQKDGPLWKDDFEAFLRAREKAIFEQISKATNW